MIAEPARGQRVEITPGINVAAVASTNPDLLPRGQEQGDIYLVLSPYVNFTGSAGQKFSLNGGINLGVTAQLSLNEGDTLSTNLRPNGALNGTWEAIDNFFFIDVSAAAASQLNDPFLATPGPYSPTNTSTSYQLGVAPYIRGQLRGNFDYVVRSANSWTNFTDTPWQYSVVNSVDVVRSPQPWGGAFNYTQTIVSSDIEGQPNLVSNVARLSLRYAFTDTFALGARIGAEKYNFTLTDRDWKRYYGAEVAWRPNSRTSLEGYWEDRVFGNSWQVAASYRRPRSAYSFTSSRLLTTTPQQFATFPGLANLRSLLNSAFTSSIPDPVERQRAVNDFLSQTQLPAELLAPVIINSEGFQVTENNSATAILYGRRDSLALTLFWTSTLTSAGISELVPASSKTLQRGAELAFARTLNSTTTMNASATWRNTENQLDTEQQTNQTQLLISATRQITPRINGTLGARYQWINSTVSNDAVEAAVYLTLSYTYQ